MKNIDEATKNKIIALISALVPDAKIILYGSRARGDFMQWSDIDLALDTGKRMPVESVDEVISVIRETNIPYKVEIVDLYNVSEEMQASIKKDGIIWKS
jgi:predicted nucleotidyltransferase